MKMKLPTVVIQFWWIHDCNRHRFWWNFEKPHGSFQGVFASLDTTQKNRPERPESAISSDDDDDDDDDDDFQVWLPPLPTEGEGAAPILDPLAAKEILARIVYKPWQSHWVCQSWEVVWSYRM